MILDYEHRSQSVALEIKSVEEQAEATAFREQECRRTMANLERELQQATARAQGETEARARRTNNWLSWAHAPSYALTGYWAADIAIFLPSEFRMPSLLSPKHSQVLAFYLPQYHPIPENDEWWGKGFAEWTKVTRGRSLFKGHQQPHLPADLGFYDLRLPETRAYQAELAREAGLDGFIYYHYWFSGRRLLERPFDEVLKLKQPDFPFCLCWANEPWSRNWDGESRSVLMAQSYSQASDLEHIRWLLTAFADERYIKIDGRPLFLIYRPSDLPDIRRDSRTLANNGKASRIP